MSTSLVENSYGKSQVRLTKVTRNGARHELKEICVNVQLQGDFDRAYTDGDNSHITATDTIKNTVYARAAQHPIDTIESFAKHLGEYFLSANQSISAVSIEIAQERFERINTKGKPHDHAFTAGNSEKRVAHVDTVRGAINVESGIENLVILKTANSEFWGFIHDNYTTLPETRDRIFATSVVVHWLYKDSEVNFDSTYDSIRQLLLDVFAEHHSLSVQQTLYEIGRRILDQCPAVEGLRMSMPNQHRNPVDLSKFGLPNSNEIFVPTAEPFGLITATLSRSTQNSVGEKSAQLSAHPFL